MAPTMTHGPCCRGRLLMSGSPANARRRAVDDDWGPHLTATLAGMIRFGASNAAAIKQSGAVSERGQQIRRLVQGHDSTGLSHQPLSSNRGAIRPDGRRFGEIAGLSAWHG